MCCDKNSELDLNFLVLWICNWTNQTIFNHNQNHQQQLPFEMNICKLQI